MRQYQRNTVKKAAIVVGAIVIPVIGLVFGLKQIKNIQQIFIQAQYQPANLKIDALGIVGDLNRPWLFFAQGGESPQFSLKPFIRDFQQIKPKYIRIDHLYDFYIKVSRTDKGFSYDFSKLDQLLSEFKSNGVLPFISLSYTPDVLNSDITGVPSDWNEYQKIIQRTIEHISGKNELALSNVYYEVWNEPDLFGQWKTYGPKNYLTLYMYAAKGAQQAANTLEFKFGGPATTKLYDNWIDNMFNMVTTQNIRCDFYSWHHYSSDPQDYVQDVDRIKAKLTEYPMIALNTELIISEWGIDSNNNPAYDNSIGASHLVATVLSFHQNLSKAFIFEIQDGKSPENKEYWGRWGLYTHTDFGAHPKPRAAAIQLLNQLGNQELSIIGQGSFVKAIAVKKNTTMQILLSNYDVSSKNTETVPVTIKRMSPGMYQISRTYLGRSKSTTQIHISDSTYNFSIPMIPNSVVLYELTPL